MYTQNGKTPKAASKNSTKRSKQLNTFFSPPEKDPQNKFRPLIEAGSLLLLQLVSLATTLDGSKLLFGDERMPFVEQLPIAYVLGFGIQLLLICILVFNGFEKIPVRRLIALLLLSAFSIYTNFFSIYNVINGKLLENNTSIDLAQRKYENLVTYFYTNPKDELNGLKQKSTDLQCRLFQEDSQGTPQPKGCPDLGFKEGQGIEYDFYKAELDRVNRDLSNFNQNYIEDTAPIYFAPKITETLQDKNAKEIYELSKQALMNIPSQIEEKAKAEGYKPEEYDEMEDFFPEKGKSSFLIPGQKVFTSKENREPVAVVGFVLALAIDGISLLLGAKLNGFYSSLKESLGSINPLADIFNGSLTYLEDIGKSIVPFMEAPLVYLGKIFVSLAEGSGTLIASFFNGLGILLISLINGVFGLFKHIFSSLRSQAPGKKLRLIKSNGSGVEFLDTLYNAILKGKSDLLNEDSKNFQLYRALISNMREKGYFADNNTVNQHQNSSNTSRPNRFSSENNQQDLILRPKGKKAFNNWYFHQRNMQLEREQRNLGNKNRNPNAIDFPPAI